MPYYSIFSQSNYYLVIVYMINYYDRNKNNESNDWCKHYITYIFEFIVASISINTKYKSSNSDDKDEIVNQILIKYQEFTNDAIKILGLTGDEVLMLIDLANARNNLAHSIIEIETGIYTEGLFSNYNKYLLLNIINKIMYVNSQFESQIIQLYDTIEDVLDRLIDDTPEEVE